MKRSVRVVGGEDTAASLKQASFFKSAVADVSATPEPAAQEASGFPEDATCDEDCEDQVHMARDTGLRDLSTWFKTNRLLLAYTTRNPPPDSYYDELAPYLSKKFPKADPDLVEHVVALAGCF